MSEMTQLMDVRTADSHRDPLVVEIKRNSLDDGPGIRTTLFFKGCPLACVWCHNPEAISPRPEILVTPSECVAGCDACVAACPEGAITLAATTLAAEPGGSAPEPGSSAASTSPTIDRATCTNCGLCVDACPGRGLRLIGRHYGALDLIAEALVDEPFYRRSGGGVTFSGGEATLYPHFMERLLAALKARGVHTLLETCGYYHGETFQRRMLPRLDQIFFDVKLADPDTHQRYTGRPNHLILRNLADLALSPYASRVLPRVPLIPGITDTDDNLAAIALLLRELGFRQVALLPYNPTWFKKAEGVGRELQYRHAEWLPAEAEERCRSIFRRRGLEVV